MESRTCSAEYRCFTVSRLRPAVAERLEVAISGDPVTPQLAGRLAALALAEKRYMPNPPQCTDCPRVSDCGL